MTIKIFDTFTGTFGTDLADHTPDIDVVTGGWTDTAVNRCELDGVGGVKFFDASDSSWIDAGAVDQWCVSNWNSGGADNRMSIVLRRDNLAHNLMNGYPYNFRQADSGVELKILKSVSGSQTVIAAGSFTNNSATTYSFEPEIDGASLDFKIDGISELLVTDSSITTGGYAAIVHEKRTNGDGRFYDFQIDDVAPVSAGIEVFRRRMIMRKAA